MHHHMTDRLDKPSQPTRHESHYSPQAIPHECNLNLVIMNEQSRNTTRHGNYHKWIIVCHFVRQSVLTAHWWLSFIPHTSKKTNTRTFYKVPAAVFWVIRYMPI
jgi:hypothetical protein